MLASIIISRLRSSSGTHMNGGNVRNRPTFVIAACCNRGWARAMQGHTSTHLLDGLGYTGTPALTFWMDWYTQAHHAACKYSCHTHRV